MGALSEMCPVCGTPVSVNRQDNSNVVDNDNNTDSENVIK